MSNDPIRDQLWASVYASLLAKGMFWCNCEDEANKAVKAYDRRAAAALATPSEERP